VETIYHAYTCLSRLYIILNAGFRYQFNFVVDAQFATESGLIAFFGYFRGAMNIISLFLLLFVGRIYGRWGLPVALMFHPFNYMLVFLSFLLRFDIFAAMYARMSTNIIRTTLNKPATAILMGLFPESYRAAVRPFLRGTVVRIGLVVSSVMILISEKLFHPRYLSLVAIPLVAAWIMTTRSLKKSYSNILLDLISKNMLDLKSMEEEDVEQLFKDDQSRSHLVEAFLAARGEDALWFARLLKFLAVKELDTHIIATLNNQDDRIQIELINMLSGDIGETAVPALRPLVDPEKPELMVAVIKAVNRLSPDYCWDFDLKIFETNKHPEVKAYALVALFCQEPEHYRTTIDSWLDSDDMHDRKAGVIAAGESGEDVYVVRLKAMLDAAENESILDIILQAIHRLGAPEMNDLMFFYLDHPLESVRVAALEAFKIHDDQTLNRVISLMADTSERVYRKAKAKIDTASYHNGQLLVESLSTPRRRVREGLFDLLASLDVKDLDAFRFARSQIETCYNYLSEAEAIRLLPQSSGRNLLIDHLEQKRKIRLENILRVLALKERSGQMRIILRSIFSSDSRQRANGLEALDAITDAALSKLLLPLLDDSPSADTLAAGRKHFQLPVLSTDGNALYAHQLAQEDWVTNVITLYMAQEHDLEKLDQGMVRVLTASGNAHVRQMARYILVRQQGHSANKEDTMEPEISIPDKIIHLKEIGIFKGLSVGELAAIASVSEEVVYAPDETVIKEGETGETMYMIVEGELSVFKHGTEIDQFSAGESFGEMALIEDELRSATIRTKKASRFLVLHKQEFKEIVQEYPQIALSICKVLSGYVRKLHLKATAQEK